MLRAAAARPKLSLVTPAASSSRHRSRASLCEGSRMCCTVTSRVASFTFPTTSSSQLIAGAAGIRRHATARAVGGIAVKQATSIAFDDSRHRSAARRMSWARANRDSETQRTAEVHRSPFVHTRHSSPHRPVHPLPVHLSPSFLQPKDVLSDLSCTVAGRTLPG